MTVDTPQTTQRDGLVDHLHSNQNEVISWVEKAPLKLIGATLTDLGGSGDEKNLETRLEPVFRGSGVEWSNWWKKVRPALKDSPEYFKFQKNRYALITSVQYIPIEPLLTKPTWNEWLKSKQWPLPDKQSLPGTKPPDKIIKWDVGSCNEEMAKRLTPRAIFCADEFLRGKTRTSQSAQKWLELLLSIISRHRELSGLQPGSEVGLGYETLGQLLQLLQDRDSGKSLLLESIKQAITNTGWRKTLASVLWEKYRYSDQESRALLEYLADRLDSPERIALWDEMTLASFSEMGFTNRTTDLDRILSFLSKDDERTIIIQRIIHRAVLREAPRDDVASLVANSRYAGKPTDESKKLTALVTAALLLPEGRDRFISEVRECFRVALEDPESKVCNPIISDLLNVARNRISEVERQGQAELDKEQMVRHSQVADRENKIQGLRTQIAEKREESRLDIRRDMLLVMAETLRDLHQKRTSPENMLRDVEARVRLAILAGGAEFYGKVGELVEFDPRLHTGPEGTPRGASVTVSSSGAIVRGKLTNDFVVLKALVNRWTEVK